MGKNTPEFLPKGMFHVRFSFRIGLPTAWTIIAHIDTIWGILLQNIEKGHDEQAAHRPNQIVVRRQ